PCVMARCRISCLLPTSWPQMTATWPWMLCSAHSFSSAFCGVAEQTIMSASDASRSRLGRTNGNGGVLCDIAAVASLIGTRQRPAQRQLQVGVARPLDLGLERRVAQLRLALRPGAQALQLGDAGVAGPHLGPLAQQVECLQVRREAVGAAPPGVQVDELARL